MFNFRLYIRLIFVNSPMVKTYTHMNFNHKRVFLYSPKNIIFYLFYKLSHNFIEIYLRFCVQILYASFLVKFGTMISVHLVVLIKCTIHNIVEVNFHTEIHTDQRAPLNY